MLQNGNGGLPSSTTNESIQPPRPKNLEGGKSNAGLQNFSQPASTVSALRPEQAEALLSISALLNQDLNPGRVLFGLISQIKSLFHADRAAVFLRQNLFTDEEGTVTGDLGPVICAASIGLSDEYINSLISYYEEKEFRHLQSLRRPVYIANTKNDVSLNGLREVSEKEGFICSLSLPLLNHENLVGILQLYHNQPRVYSSDEIRILTIFANQAALSITNSRLFDEVRQREIETARLSEAGRVFNSTLKLREVLQHVGMASVKLLGNSVMVFVVQEGAVTASPIFWYSNLEHPQLSLVGSPLRLTRPVVPGEGAVGKTLESGMPYLLTGQREILKAAPFIRTEEQPVSLLCVPLKATGKTIGVLASYQVSYGQDQVEFQDKHQISLAVQLADRAAIAIQNARLYEAEKREQRAKDEFLSLVSHELKTPLTSIKGYHKLLNKRLELTGPPDPDEQERLIETTRHYSEVMTGQIDRLQSLIEELSTISLIEMGKLELQVENTEIVSLVQEQINLIESSLGQARQPRFRHIFEIKALPQVIFANVDPEALSRVIHNILSNAVKFSPKGGTIWVRVQQGSDEIYIIVQDDGIGMSLAFQERIFDRFYKANTHPNRANGLGLGLYISKNLLEGMGGRIKVESNEGLGSTFTVSLRRPPKTEKVELDLSQLESLQHEF